MDDKTLLPYKVIDGVKDVRWNTQKVNSEILQGILQGDSIPNLAKRLRKVTEMNRDSAIRNARTSCTSAENKGRMDMIEDAEEKGAEKLLYALNRLVFFINNNGENRVTELFGHANIEMILREFAPHRIIKLVKELNYHVPTQGDVYRSKHTNNTVVVLSYNEKTRETRYIAHNYESREKEDYLNEHYYFTGENIDVSALVNKIG